MAEFNLSEPGSNLHDELNKILLRDAGKTNYGTRIIWTAYDGTTRDRRTGVVTSTGDHTLWIENRAGFHIKVTHSVTHAIIFNLTDAGLVLKDLTINENLNVKGNTSLGDQ